MPASSLKDLVFLSLLAGSGTAAAAEGQPLQGIRRVVFVGDSITYAGQYWLTATGHRRPGMNKGLMLPEAERQAQEIEAKIRKLVVAVP